MNKSLSARLLAHGWLIAGLVGVAFYLPSLSYDFTYDDILIVTENPRIKSLAHPRAYLWTSYWNQTNQNREYRPLTLLSYAINYAFAGANPFSYRVCNLLLHGGICASIALLVTMLFGRRDLALGAAALFAVHPIHVEVVAGVVGRAELMASLGFILALLCAIRSMRSSTEAARWGWGALAALPAALAMGSKENGLTIVPALMILPLFCPQARGSEDRKGVERAAWFAAIPSLLFTGVVAAIYLGLRYLVLGGLSGPRGQAQVSAFDNPLIVLDGPSRILMALKLLVRYALMLVFPYHPSPDFSYGAIPMTVRIFDPALIAGAAMVPLFIWVGWKLRARPPAFFGVLVFFITFILTSNLLFPIGTILAERLLYLPSLGFCIFAADLGEGCWTRLSSGRESTANRPWLRPFLVVAILLWGVSFAFQTLRYLPTWRNNDVLFTYMVRRVPGSARAQLNYAAVLQKEKKPQEAIAALKRSLEIMPRQSTAMGRLGGMYLAENRLADARAILEEGFALDPTDAQVVINLARVYATEGDRARAEELYPLALQVNPNNYALHRDFGLLLEENGKLRPAIEHLQAFLTGTLNREDAQVFAVLGRAWFKLDDIGRAEENLRRALELNPKDSSCQFTLVQLLVKAGRVREAEPLARDLVERSPQDKVFRKLLEGVLLKLEQR